VGGEEGALAASIRENAPAVEQDAAQHAPVPQGVADSIAVSAEAPVSPPPARSLSASSAVAPPPPPPPGRAIVQERRRQLVTGQPGERAWTRRDLPPRSRIADGDPRNRESYNQLSEVLAAYAEWPELRRVALRWQPYDPENPQVYEVLGLAAGELGDETEEARAFASLIEVAPAKTELLQRAGLLLVRAHRARLAEAPLRRALELRPDRANGYRHLALMLWLDGRVEEAARVLESATRQSFPGWYGDVQRVIREELGYVYRAWMKKEPSRRDEIAERAREHDVDLTRRDALRVTLAWETDANDVDLHVVDPSGEETFYGHPSARSGLSLYGDITQGLGPEVIRTGTLSKGTYHVGVRYFAAGPMGISRGVVVVLRGDDDIQIHPFRLAIGGGDIRYVTAVKY